MNELLNLTAPDMGFGSAIRAKGGYRYSLLPPIP